MESCFSPLEYVYSSALFMKQGKMRLLSQSVIREYLLVSDQQRRVTFCACVQMKKAILFFNIKNYIYESSKA